jgi:hypothetical protein
MSVNDENDPGDGNKYQKSKASSLSLVNNEDSADLIKDYLCCSFEFSIIPKLRSSQSPEDCFTKSKHDKHDCQCSFTSSTMARVKYAQWIRVTSMESNIRFISRIR